MTEAEWLTNTELSVLQSGLSPSQVSDRRIRLFRVACCRTFWSDLTIKIARDAVSAAEAYADGLLGAEELEWINRQGFVRFSTYCRMRNVRRANRDPLLKRRITLAGFAIDTTSANASALFPIRPDNAVYRYLKDESPALLRDIFGSPFRPVPADPAWLSTTVTAMSEGIYRDRAFDRLPILADALEEAGCEDSDILAHCRGPGPHVRGCWVIDLILGKE